MKRTSSQLSYAPRPHWTRRRAVWRALFIFSAMLVAVSAFLWVPPAWQRIRLLQWQRRCMDHQATGGCAFLAGSPAEIAAVAGQADYRQVRLENLAVAFRVPAAWQNYSELANGVGRVSQGTLFLGQRQSASGHVRLVAVDAYISTAPPRRVFLLPRVIVPGSLLEASRETPRQSSFLLGDLSGDLRVRQGRADSDNAARFTIEYTADSPHVLLAVSGFLGDDDTVQFEQQRPRSIAEPASSPPPPSSPGRLPFTR